MGCPSKMGGRILVQIILGLHFAAAKKQYNQYQSFLGCFKDDGKRDIKKYLGNVNSIETCRAKAKKKGYRYFALQYGVECRAGNSYGTPYKTYPQIPVSKCTRKRATVFSPVVIKSTAIIVVVGGQIRYI